MRTTHLVCVRGSIVRSHQGKLYATDEAHGNILRDSDTQKLYIPTCGRQ